jgi:hypothetical protein
MIHLGRSEIGTWIALSALALVICAEVLMLMLLLMH